MSPDWVFILFHEDFMYGELLVTVCNIFRKSWYATSYHEGIIVVWEIHISEKIDLV